MNIFLKKKRRYSEVKEDIKQAIALEKENRSKLKKLLWCDLGEVGQSTLQNWLGYSLDPKPFLNKH